MLPEVCVVYLIERDPSGDRVLLGRKKTGLGQGKLVGPGGKLEVGETPNAAAVREVAEEIGVDIAPTDLLLIGDLTYLFPHHPAWSQRSWAFMTTTWTGVPESTFELDPVWVAIDAIPFEEMWSDAGQWLPVALAGSRVTATFEFGADNESVVSANLAGA